MARTDPFDTHTDDYDRWFDEHPLVYEAEPKAVDALLPPSREGGLEIGVGSAKFASRLGVPVGVEPSIPMAERAVALGIDVQEALLRQQQAAAGVQVRSCAGRRRAVRSI